MSEVQEISLKRGVKQTARPCTEPDCPGVGLRRGLCVKHYSRVIYAQKKEDPEGVARKRAEREQKEATARRREQRRQESARKRALDPAKEAAYQKQYQAARKDKLGLARRLNTYGLTISAFDRMLVTQAHACVLCLRAITGPTCHVDHCHVTGRVRGLLCGGCNTGLGHYERFARLGSLERISGYLATPA
jgi:hypothetical protein